MGSCTPRCICNLRRKDGVREREGWSERAGRAERGERAIPRFLPPRRTFSAEPRNGAKGGKAMEGPGLIRRKTATRLGESSTPAPTFSVRRRGRCMSATVLRYPHACLRRLAEVEGVSGWGVISVRRQRSTAAWDGITTRGRVAREGNLRWGHEGPREREGSSGYEGPRGHDSPKGHEGPREQRKAVLQGIV